MQDSTSCVRLISAILLLFLTSLCSGQSTLRSSFQSNYPADGFGRSTGNAGDVDGDGFDDLIIGAPSWGIIGNAVSSALGAAFVFSGKDGTRLYRKLGPVAGFLFGGWVDGAGDVNGDGFDDFAVSENHLSRRFGLYSGVDGQLIRHYASASSMVTKRDFDGDGKEDVVLGYPQASPNGLGNAGVIRIRSGDTNALLLQINGFNLGDRFGERGRIAVIDDANADGVPEIVVANGGTSSNMGGHVFSGADGALLHSVNPSTPGHRIIAIQSIGDFDLDGHGDFFFRTTLVSSNGSYTFASEIVSGFDPTIKQLLPSNVTVQALGDVNGDLVEDYAYAIEASTDPVTQISSPHRIEFFSGQTHSLLWTDYFQVPGSSPPYGSGVFPMSDLNGDGFCDYMRRDVLTTGYPEIHVRHAPTLPILKYDSSNGNTSLDLAWIPNNGSASDVLGILRCTGATPGGLGIFGASFAPGDFPLGLGVPLLLATDPSNFVVTGNFIFDAIGELQAPQIGRQYPYIAGYFLHLQVFENSPNPAASNGVRLEIAP